MINYYFVLSVILAKKNLIKSKNSSNSLSKNIIFKLSSFIVIGTVIALKKIKTATQLYKHKHTSVLIFNALYTRTRKI